ncbi:YecR family lipoprotein [Marivita sp. S0852]|uniref:YecR family lipoprotein n=1 Tax=Marivita sp. S0852 TaxID=3373893 RepID=UPI003981ACEF
MPIDGSRSDGMVVSQMTHNPNLGYRPDYSQLRNSAKQACMRWGFRSAAPFGTPQQFCDQYGQNGRCDAVLITQKHQCSV